MASVQDESCLSQYRKLLIELSLDLSSKDLEMLTFAAADFIPRGRIENIRTGLQFFLALEQDMKIGPRNMSLLQDMFQTIGRVDLARRVQSYSKESVEVTSDGKSSLHKDFKLISAGDVIFFLAQNICQICGVAFSLWTLYKPIISFLLKLLKLIERHSFVTGHHYLN